MGDILNEREDDLPTHEPTAATAGVRGPSKPVGTGETVDALAPFEPETFGARRR